MLEPVPFVHAQAGFDYYLSNTGSITLVPGGSGSTNINATLTGGTAANITLSCDQTTLPAGASCLFVPAMIKPTSNGNATSRLTVTVPSSLTYSAYNVTVTASPTPAAPSIVALFVAAKVAVSPTATNSTSLIVGSAFSIEVNVTDSTPFSGFAIGIFYNNLALVNPAVDFSGTVLGTATSVGSECINGVGAQCNFDNAYDGEGVISLALFTTSGDNTTTPTGKLFSITFTVNRTNTFSTMHFVNQLIGIAPSGNPLRVVAYDGYFTNKSCGVNLCKPPIVSFSTLPNPIALRHIVFNGTAVSQNPSGVITEYNWTWSIGPSRFFCNVPSKNCSPKLSTNVTFTFPEEGSWIVTLSVQDNFTARAYYSVELRVSRIWVDIGISDLTIDPIAQVLPATIVHIKAAASNYGVRAENSSLTVLINGQNITSQPVSNIEPAKFSTIVYDWHTSGLTPRVYRIEIDLAEVRDSTTGRVLENDTEILHGGLVDPNNVRVAYVQIIESVPPGVGVLLGLNLTETLGLGLVLVAAIVLGAGFVKKARARGPEPLETPSSSPLMIG